MKRTACLLVAVGAVMTACVGGGAPTETEVEAIEVFGPWRGSEADHFAEVLAVFEDESGLDVQYVGSANFVVDLERRTGEANDPADVAIVPQPGLIGKLADDGHIVPLVPEVNAAVVEHFGAANAELGRFNNEQFTIPYRITVKSLVWYRPTLFAEHDWTVPESLDELEELLSSIAATDDVTPWCLGIESGTATGWVATDWTEDLVVRSIGPDGYQEWVDGEIDFADPRIAEAFARFRSLALDPGRSLGGIRSVIETPVSEAVLPLLADSDACALHRQSDVAVNWLPDGTSIGPDSDVDFFVFPGAVAGAAPPLVIGSDQVVQFRDGDDVNALMAFLASPRAAAIWARRGGFLSPNSGVPEETYPANYLRELTDAFDAAPAIVLDASDQMTPAIGSGLLWDRITDWVSGLDSYDTFAAVLDEAIQAARAVDLTGS